MLRSVSYARVISMKRAAAALWTSAVSLKTLSGMMLRREFAVGGDDAGARSAAPRAEDAQQLGGLALIARVERRRDPVAVGSARPRVFGVVDVIEAVDLAQPGQGVGLEAEGEAEIEQGRVLAQRHGRGAVGDQADGGVEEPRPLFRRGDLREALSPAGDVDSDVTGPASPALRPDFAPRNLRRRAAGEAEG